MKSNKASDLTDDILKQDEIAKKNQGVESKEKPATQKHVRYVVPEEDFYLTEREYQCLLRISEDTTTKDIAKDLNLASRTIEFYLKMLRDKSNSKNKTELIQFANKVKDQLIITTVRASA